jgi:pimeloyl-ACP methyl ester carboxylesterase
MLKKIAFVSLGLLALGVLVLGAWYQIDGQPLPEAAGFLQGEGYAAVVEADGGLVFTPAAPNGHGLLIMHGALIKPLSYAKSAAFFAARGYTVFVPSGAARLSINAVDGAVARMGSFGVRDWVMIGHSMGGFSTLTLIERHSPEVKAVALWACAMPADFSALKVPMLFIHGDRDGLLPPERLADAKALLPPATRYVTLPGANHQGFAMYSHQFFDNPATIGWREQIDFADEKTAAFFAAQLNRG